jgi:Mn2+/Fe2+ NRAMP family transporter
MNRLLGALFWSILTAAFIGPGTVATCASAGSRHGFILLWAVGFSTLACLVLQEATGRLTIVSGMDLGGAIRLRFRGHRAGPLVLILVLGGILLGCAAYEAGNILGAVAGAVLGTHLPGRVVVLACAAFAGLLLWFGRTRDVARILGAAVGLMGTAFMVVALLLRPSPAGLLRHVLIPEIPEGSGLLVLGLLGTTVVPYNLFLGSGLARGQTLKELRWGLSVAIPVGGLLSMAILVVGTAVAEPFGFEALAATLADRLGRWAAPFFALGLFTAGLSSAITAPMAAAVTARSLFGERRPQDWAERGWRYRASWLSVLLVGITLGLLDLKPVPAILVAQAFNGLLLPFVAVFLWVVINDRAIMGETGRNRLPTNLIMGMVTFVTLILGSMNALGALASALALPRPPPRVLLMASALAALLIAAPLRRLIGRGAGRTPMA